MGPIQNRKCTDILFFLLMIIFWLGGIAVLGYAIYKGDPTKILDLYEPSGEICGKGLAKDYPLGYLYNPIKQLKYVMCLK